MSKRAATAKERVLPSVAAPNQPEDELPIERIERWRALWKHRLDIEIVPALQDALSEKIEICNMAMRYLDQSDALWMVREDLELAWRTCDRERERAKRAEAELSKLRAEREGMVLVPEKEKIEQLRKDADRYRWLRAIMFFTVREWGTFVEFPDGLVFCVPISHEKGKQNPAIDAAIDAALSASGGKEGKHD